jgi:dihydrofolate reductase
MSKLRVQSFAISIDGYGAGPNQDLQNPLGVRGPELMDWFFPTRVWRRMHGHDDGETGVDNVIAEQGFAGIGAWILGRNIWPCPGPWPDDNQAGGAIAAVSHARLRVTSPAGAAWDGQEYRVSLRYRRHSRRGTGDRCSRRRDVRLGGGVSTIRQYRRVGLIDELHLAIRPVLLGSGEHLLNNIDMHALGYVCAKDVAGERATHVFLRKRA